MNQKEAVQLARVGVWLIMGSTWIRVLELNPAEILPAYRITLAFIGGIIILDVLFQTMFGMLDPEEKEIDEQ